ncbi:MAG TPA: hypothetical protein VNA32_08145 [Actinomycetota bacterium]|nr:hypothetical protein [Actinomycetota bacterium]
MPIGRYAVMDGDGNVVGTEDFRSAPGPAGWRYFSDIQTTLPQPHHEIVDIVVDSGWRPVRTRISTASHEILLMTEGEHLIGYRDGVAVEAAWGPDVELDYASPTYNVVTANRLGSTTAEFDVVLIQPVTCQLVVEHQRYEHLGQDEVATSAGRFASVRWRYTAPSIGRSRDLWIAGDVVVRCDGLYELETYEPGASGPVPLA